MTRRIFKKAFDKIDGWAGDVHPAAIDGWIAWWPRNTDPEFTKKAYQHAILCPYGQPGDRLWVRETWKPMNDLKGGGIPRWGITCGEGCTWKEGCPDQSGPWKPSIFMPRWASRITLEIMDIRVERLQEITEEDALKEGCEREMVADGSSWGAGLIDAVENFEKLWDSINGKKYPWSSNPWVWVISFRRSEAY
jgi:hypothetical protein